jgi:pyruvate/2-oxoglutarate dehydrogenase complex dihydrolipoamide acyltransferase (E2) component
MPTVTMPQLGESVEEGTIGKWLKKEGDHVAVGEPLVEVITDKVNAEVPSPFEGTLTRILVAEGETVQNDAGIAEVEAAASEGAESDPAAQPRAAATDAPLDAAAPGAPAEAPDPGSVPSDTAPATAVETVEGPPEVSPTHVPGGNGSAGERGEASTEGTTPVAARAPELPAGSPTFRGRMTPAVRRLAREHAVDLSRVEGTGLGGRVTREDVQRAIDSGAAGSLRAGSAAPAGTTAAASTSAPSPVAAGDALKKATPMRRAIAAQMTRSLEVPTAYITFEVDMTAVVRRRERMKGDYQAREGISLSYVAFVTKACVEALRQHPDFNAHWADEGHWLRKAINVGIAVAVEDGLVVPVIRDADTLSLHGLNVAINDLARRARDRKLKPEELQGGTFTVDNTGWTGSILTLPIINVPEVAIITMEKVVKRPVVLERPEGDVIAVRSMMNMCIAIDHRATDGAQAGAFLADVKAWLESVGDQTPIW